MCIGETGNIKLYFYRFCYQNSKASILGINIDNKLNFDNHTRKMYKKSGQKLKTLTRILQLLNKDKKIHFNAKIKSSFSYCL